MISPGILLYLVQHAKEQNLLRVVKISVRPLLPDLPQSVQEEQPVVVEAMAVEISNNEQKFITSAPSPGDQNSPKRDLKTYQDFTKRLPEANHPSVQ